MKKRKILHQSQHSYLRALTSFCQQVDLFVHYSTWQSRGPTRLKISFYKVWKHLRGEGNQEGRVWGGITVSGGCWGIHGQSCLAPAHSTVRERLNRAVAEAGLGSMCVWTHWRVFKASRLLEHTEFLRGRTAEPGSPWERLTQRSGSLRQN